MGFFDKYKNTKCPECGYNLGADWGVERVIRESPKWYEFSSYRIHHCLSCGISLKFKNQLIAPALFILFLISSWYGYSYVYELHGKKTAFIFISLMACFVFVPSTLFAVSKLKLEIK